MDVATLDAARLEKLTAVFWDMTAITAETETISHSSAVEGEPDSTEHSGVNIRIDNSVVYANGSTFGAGIGSGNSSKGYQGSIPVQLTDATPSLPADKLVAVSVKITNSSIYGYSYHAAWIGGGYNPQPGTLIDVEVSDSVLSQLPNSSGYATGIGSSYHANGAADKRNAVNVYVHDCPEIKL